MYLGSTTTPGYHNSTTAVTYGSYQHIAVTYNGTTITFYKDGSAIGTGSTTGNVGSVTDFRIGRHGFTAAYPYSGNIDELALFTDAKSITDINDIMDNGLVQTSAHRIPTSLELRNVTIY